MPLPGLWPSIQSADLFGDGITRVRFNGAGQPVSLQTGQAPPPDSSGLLRLRPAPFVAAQGAIAEYFGM